MGLAQDQGSKNQNRSVLDLIDLGKNPGPTRIGAKYLKKQAGWTGTIFSEIVDGPRRTTS